MKKFSPRRFFLFGSYASGIPDVESDIDIIVIVDKQLEKKSRMDAMIKLNLKTGFIVSKGF